MSDTRRYPTVPSQPELPQIEHWAKLVREVDRSALDVTPDTF